MYAELESPYKCDSCGRNMLHAGLCYRCKNGLPKNETTPEERAARRRLMDTESALKRDGVPANKRRQIMRGMERRYPHGTAARARFGAGDEMTNEIAKRDEFAGQIARNGFSDAEIQVVKDSIMPGATNADLKVFLAVCQQSGLNPLCSPAEIWAVPFNKNLAKQGQPAQWVKTYKPITSIDGLRVAAYRSRPLTGYRGQVGPQWCDVDGIWRDVWLKKTPPAACRVGVVLDGMNEPMWSVTTWEQWKGAQDKKGSKWGEMPAHMLAIAAEKQALRRACPNLKKLFREVAKEPEEYEAVEGEVTECDPETGEIVTPEETLQAELVESAEEAVQMGEAVENKADLRLQIKARAREIGPEAYAQIAGNVKVSELTAAELRGLLDALNAWTPDPEPAAAEAPEPADPDAEDDPDPFGGEYLDGPIPEDRAAREDMAHKVLLAIGRGKGPERASWFSERKLPLPPNISTLKDADLLRLINSARHEIREQKGQAAA